jgi:NADH-quinone oxidoreductase subunit L
MAAGAIIVSLHHEQDIFKMGGLRRQLPAVFWTFLAGAMSLAAFPLISAGFYSKDEILWQAWSSPQGGPWLWLAGLIGALLTSVYTFRAVFIVFFGEEHGHVTSRPGGLMTKPLWILAALSLFAGVFKTPVTHLLETTPLWAHAVEAAHAKGELGLQLAAIAAGLIGIYIAASLFLFKPGSTREWLATPMGAKLSWLSASGCGFDWVYDRILVKPFIGAARFAKNDFTGFIDAVIVYVNEGLNYALHATQTGKMRWYAMGMAVGAVITLAIVILL